MNRVLPLPEAVGWKLSPHAAEVLGSIRRDPARTCDSEALRALLKERGLPAFDSILDFEARCGGADLGWRGSTFGTFAAISTWERRPRGDRLTDDALLEQGGKLLLPIAFDEHDPENGFWMDESGTIYYDEDLEETYAFASSGAVFLERVAFLAKFGPWRDPRFTDSDGTLVIHQTMGRMAAEALGVPLFSPASDTFSSTWYEPARALIVEEATYWRSTTVTAALDVVVSAAQAAARHAPDALASWRGNGPPPAAAETIAARLPKYDPGAGKDASGEILFIGSPGYYRVHQYYNERFRYLAPAEARQGRS